MPSLNSKLLKQLNRQLKGRVKSNPKLLKLYSHDASLFEVEPQAIAFPRDAGDIAALIHFVNHHHWQYPDLSLTARAAGTDMSGGAINNSIIVDFKYLNGIGRVDGRRLSAQPGAYYRDFEKVSLRQGLLMPAYPASRELCKIGGMVANNAGGEKSLNLGKTDRYITSLKVVLQDGHEYEIKPLNRRQLDKKLKQTDFEGQIYQRLFKLLESNYPLIRQARPQVSKDSTAYHLWDVWDKKTFDLTKLFVGSQGTLGLITEATFKLVPAKPYSGLLIAFLPDLKHLGEIIKTVIAAKPDSFESFDDHTLRFALRFFPYFRRRFGWFGLIKLGIRLLPEARLLASGMPKLILMAEFGGNRPEVISSKIKALAKNLEPFDVRVERADNAAKSQKFWLLRRESFNILRHNVKQLHTAPFIDDFIVPPKHLSQFLPRLTEILDRYELTYTIAGHLGDGNFHIIPLMALQQQTDRDKIEPVMREVNSLVLAYGGSLSAEHNDGLIRGPFLPQMYGARMMAIFKEVKYILDPHNIFNPHKKTDADWQFSLDHIRRRF